MSNFKLLVFAQYMQISNLESHKHAMAESRYRDCVAMWEKLQMLSSNRKKYLGTWKHFQHLLIVHSIKNILIIMVRLVSSGTCPIAMLLYNLTTSCSVCKNGGLLTIFKCSNMP